MGPDRLRPNFLEMREVAIKYSLGIIRPVSFVRLAEPASTSADRELHTREDPVSTLGIAGQSISSESTDHDTRLRPLAAHRRTGREPYEPL